jgi:hypothetical protein
MEQLVVNIKAMVLKQSPCIFTMRSSCRKYIPKSELLCDDLQGSTDLYIWEKTNDIKFYVGI